MSGNIYQVNKSFLLCPSGLTATDTTAIQCPLNVLNNSNLLFSKLHTFTKVSNPAVTIKFLPASLKMRKANVTAARNYFTTMISYYSLL